MGIWNGNGMRNVFMTLLCLKYEAFGLNSICFNFGLLCVVRLMVTEGMERTKDSNPQAYG